MTRPQYTPSHRMLNEAIIGAAHQCPSSAPVWIAEAMLDAYGEQHATAIADSLPRMIRAEHTARLRGAAIRACADPVDYPGAVTVTDHVDLQAEADSLHRLARVARNVGIAAIFAALAWGFWTVAWAQHDGARAQAERGAAEW
jgi:hypothetical protein